MSRQEIWWRGLHLACALLLPLLFFVVIGCVKAKEEKADLGDEVSFEKLEDAIVNANAGRRLGGVRTGQFASYSFVRRLENEEATINMGSNRVEVMGTAAGSSPTTIKYLLRIDEYTRNGNNTFEHKVTQDVIELLASASASATAQAQASQAAAPYVSHIATAREAQPTKVTIHNLRESTVPVEVPPAVRARPDCGGLSPCEMAVNMVQFDYVQWFSDDSYQKIAIDYGFTLKTPYLPYGKRFLDGPHGHLALRCLATMVPVEGRTVYVRDCLNLEDFQR